jgi:predicted exporter
MSHVVTSSKPVSFGSNSSRLSNRCLPCPSWQQRRRRCLTNNEQIQQYECLITDDPSLTSMVFIPFYAILDVARHFSLASTSARR